MKKSLVQTLIKGIIKQMNFVQSLDCFINVSKEVNPDFSLRKFSEMIGVSASNISRLLNNKIQPTKYIANKILENISSDIEEFKILTRECLTVIQGEYRKPSIDDLTQRVADEKFITTSEGVITRIHLEGNGISNDVESIAKKLGIAQGIVSQVINELLEDGNFDPDHYDPRVKNKPERYLNADKFPMQRKSLMDNYKYFNRRSDEILNTVIETNKPYCKKNYHCFRVLNANPERINTAKKKMDEFLINLTDYLQRGDSVARKETYTIYSLLLPMEKA